MGSELVEFFFLHGFLGRPQDWLDVINGLNSEHCHCVDYMQNSELNSSYDFRTWSNNFLKWTQRECFQKNSKKILVGYSLGGRLAAHAFLLQQENPIFHRTVVISANPFGLHSTAEADLRMQNDQAWAQKFLRKAWPEVLKEWNQQDVFNDSTFEPTRYEEDYHRESLSLALQKWSLSVQKNLSLNMQLLSPELQSQLYWLAGEKDKKYCEITHKLKAVVPHLHHQIVAQAGHRILFDQPKVITEYLLQIKKTL